jgi:hypothetical protein
MILGAKGMLADYPRAADPDTKAPYVMWADTPYEHVMVPVQLRLSVAPGTTAAGSQT